MAAHETDAPRRRERVPFPIDALGPALRSYVGAVASATGTDSSYAALAVLVTAAGCIGNRAAVLVKGGWSEPAVLWGALVGRSGTTKSPVLRIVTRPLIERFKADRVEHEKAMLAHEVEMQRYGVALAAWKAAQRDENAPSSDPPMKPESPTLPRVLVSDTTVEALAALLGSNPLGLLLVRDELAAWLGSFDRYAAGGKGSDCPAYLSMFGADPVTVDRKSGGTLFVERAAVSVCGGIQPGTLARVFGKAERESGLLARLLLAYPPERPATWTDAELPDDVQAAWGNIVGGLLDIQPQADDTGGVRPKYLGIARDAQAEYIDWHDRHARDTYHADDDDAAAHLAKLKGICPRIALVLALVDVVTGASRVSAIDADTMRRAIRITSWFRSESERVYGELAGVADDRRRDRLVHLIETRGGEVTARELVQAVRRYRGKLAAAEADLRALVKAGFGAFVAVPPTAAGGRPTERFRLGSTNGCLQNRAKPEGFDGFVDAARNDDDAEYADIGF